MGIVVSSQAIADTRDGQRNSNINNNGAWGQFLKAHRCCQCNDVMVPRPFQSRTAGSKEDRTCSVCSGVACVDCYKGFCVMQRCALTLLKSEMSNARSALGAKTNTHPSSTKHAAGSIEKATSPFMCASCRATKLSGGARVIPLRAMRAIDPTRGTSIWHIICSFAFDVHDRNTRNGIHIIQSWLHSRRSRSSPRVVREYINPIHVHCEAYRRSAAAASPPNACDRIASVDDDAEETGSPRAKIPDFSDAFRETSGRIFSAFHMNSSIRGNGVGATSHDDKENEKQRHIVEKPRASKPSTSQRRASCVTAAQPSVTASARMSLSNTTVNLLGHPSLPSKQYLAAPITPRACNKQASLSPLPSRMATKSPLLSARTVAASVSPLAPHRIHSQRVPAPSTLQQLRDSKHQKQPLGGDASTASRSRGCSQATPEAFARTDSSTVSAIASTRLGW